MVMQKSLRLPRNMRVMGRTVLPVLGVLATPYEHLYKKHAQATAFLINHLDHKSPV